MHDWSDSRIDWKGINEAAEYIGTRLRVLGRVGVRDWKEKYGTVRVYCSLGWRGIHSITHPGHHYNRYPKWLWHLDVYHGEKITRILNWIVIPYHKWLYRDTYRRAVAKWPHLRREILSAADYSSLLDGVHRVRTGKYSYTTYIDWDPRDPVLPDNTETAEEGTGE